MPSRGTEVFPLLFSFLFSPVSAGNLRLLSVGGGFACLRCERGVGDIMFCCLCIQRRNCYEKKERKEEAKNRREQSLTPKKGFLMVKFEMSWLG